MRPATAIFTEFKDYLAGLPLMEVEQLKTSGLLPPVPREYGGGGAT